jgi:5-deoxy-glucuronate isomerase
VSSQSLLVRSRDQPQNDGLLTRVTPDSAGWKYVGFEVYRLTGGMGLARRTEGREALLVMLSGRADVSFGTQAWPGGT